MKLFYKINLFLFHKHTKKYNKKHKERIIMNVVLNTKDDSIKGSFLTHFLFMGVNIFPTNNIEEMFICINKHEVSCMILDIDDNSIDWIMFVKRIKCNQKLNRMKIIILNSNRAKIFLKNIIIEGVDILLEKHLLTNFAIEKIANKLLEMNKYNDKRQYMRVIPDDNEKIFVNIEIKGKANFGYLKGRIIDLSVIGAAIRVQNKESFDIIKENKTQINTLQIIINKKVYFCDGTVLRKSNGVIVVKYNHINEFFKIGIADYISKKICL